MSEPFIGEIRLFTCMYDPLGWMTCDGRTLQISQYANLFAVLGTMYGGNGQTTFQIPNLNTTAGSSDGGRAPIGPGRGAGLQNDYVLANTYGAAGVALTGNSQIPNHNHNLVGMISDPTHTVANPTITAEISRFLVNGAPTLVYSDQNLTGQYLAQGSIGSAGSSPAQTHENRQPFLRLRFCIAFEGVFPTYD